MKEVVERSSTNYMPVGVGGREVNGNANGHAAEKEQGQEQGQQQTEQERPNTPDVSGLQIGGGAATSQPENLRTTTIGNEHTRPCAHSSLHIHLFQGPPYPSLLPHPHVQSKDPRRPLRPIRPLSCAKNSNASSVRWAYTATSTTTDPAVWASTSSATSADTSIPQT